MIEVRPFEKLGSFRNDWLNARHHFSFADYHDPARMGWGTLRVWNDDQIAPGTGFGMHGHRDMEIVTYVRRGAITHRDNLGNEGVTAAGDVQVMSAGTGIMHSEVNLGAEPCLLFQIWILPQHRGVAPRWQTRQFPRGERRGRLVTLASGRLPASPGAMVIHADAAVLGATLDAGESVLYRLVEGRKAYIVPTLGPISINGVEIPMRAGAAIADEIEVNLQASQPTEIVVVDVC